MENKVVSILGSTGSIGTQAIEVCRHLGFKVEGLAANNSVELLSEQTRILKPKKICIYNKDNYNALKLAIKDCTGTEIVCGMEGLCEVASLPQADTLLNSVVGMIGLQPTLEGIKSKKTLALANKETLVTGGSLVKKELEKNNCKMIPVDSEHSAIFQCMQGNRKEQVKSVILTASGGPFFGLTREQLKNKTAKDALKHPNWDMGAKITIDSATLMNKGLEFIEAAWLFDKKAEDIEILVHRQSVIHSMVRYCDNSVIAQLGVPDMRIPIQYALTYPDRAECIAEPLDFTKSGTLTFDKPDYETFNALSACIKAFKLGGLAPTIANGANEKAVELFLNNKISFTDIGDVVSKAVDEYESKINSQQNSDHRNISLNDIIEADRKSREYVLSCF